MKFQLGPRTILVLILMMGAGLRFYGIDWGTDSQTGTFHRFHTDESTIVELSQWVGTDLQKIKVSYGKAPMYLLWAIANTVGATVGISPFQLSDNDSARFTYILARGISALLGTLTVWIVYLIGQKLGGERTGLFSSAFLAFSPGHIQQCHFYTVDSSLTFWVTLALYLILSFPNNNRRAYLVCGFVCGIATGTRMVGVWLGIPFLLAQIWSRDLQKPIWRNLWSPQIAIYILTAAITTLACDPLILLDPDSYFSEGSDRLLLPSLQIARGETLRIWSLYDLNTTPYLYYFTHQFPFAMGTPLELAAIIGIGLAFWRRNRSIWILIAWLIPYIMMVGGLHTKPIRYTTPMIPGMAILGAWTCHEFAQRFLKASKPLRLVPFLLIGLPTLCFGLGMSRIYGLEDSRIVASRWIKNHVPEGDRVLVEKGGFPTLWMVSENLYDRDYTEGSIFITADGWTLYRFKIGFLKSKIKNAEWIVLIEENRMRQYLAAENRFPVGYTAFSQLNSGGLGFDRAVSFKVNPGIAGWEFDEGEAEPTFSAFDHPRVTIFRRRPDVNPEDLLNIWKERVEKDDRLPDVHILSGVRSYKQQDWETAVQHYSRALERRPDMILAHLLIAEVDVKKGHKDAVRKIWEEVGLGSAQILRNAMLSLIDVGLIAEGTAYLEQILENTKEKRELESLVAYANFNLGVEHLESEQFEEAIKAFHRTLKFTENHIPAMLNLSEAYRMTGKDSLALGTLQQAVHLDSTSHEAWYGLALFQGDKGDLVGKQQSLSRAFVLDPASSVYQVELFNVAANFYYAGNPYRALDIYLFIRNIIPELPQTHFNLGKLYLDANEFQLAIESFRTADRLLPGDPSNILGLASAFDGLGSKEEAIKTYRHLLELNPNHKIARERLGNLLNP